MRPGPTNSLADIAGLSVGHATDELVKTGVSVVVGDAPMVASVHVMGGAPGTRETDLLRPDAMVEGVDALVLSGGSAFGLAAADGVADGLRADGRGFVAAGHKVPIVPAAILFDLANGGDKDWQTSPYPELGRAAYAARKPDARNGSFGAGAGATVAGLKGGLGTASAQLPSGATVAAMVAVNALGQVTVGQSANFWAAPFEEGAEFGALGPSDITAPPPVTKLDSTANTTIAVVATDLTLTKPQAKRLAIASHDGIARAVVPAHTPFDGDLVFACSTGQRAADDADLLALGHAGATCLARAIARGVYEAEARENDVLPTWQAMFAS